MTPTTTTAPPTLGRVSRWKLTEPVRFYLWPVLALLLAVELARAAAAGEWLGLLFTVPALVVLGASIEFARRSVFTLPGIIKTFREHAQ